MILEIIFFELILDSLLNLHTLFYRYSGQQLSKFLTRRCVPLQVVNLITEVPTLKTPLVYTNQNNILYPNNNIN